jgi:alginate O-acetyltransferase complex protein AlgJ
VKRTDRPILRILRTLPARSIRPIDVPVWLALVGVLGGLIFGVAGGGVATAVRTTAGALDLPTAAVDGTLAQVVDEAVENHHPFRPAAVTLITLPRYLLFREAQEGVVVGREGWLFTAEEFETADGDEMRRSRRTAHIVSQVDAAAKREITTVVVLLPSKARIAADRLPRRLRNAAESPRYDRTLRELRDAGVLVVDPRPVLEADLFFSRDTHWRPEGAAAVTNAVADVVTLPTDRQSTFRLQVPGANAPEQAGVELTGDLLGFVPVGPVAPLLGLTPEHYQPVVAEPGADQTGSGGLFDTPTIPITLVGTSYSADERWGFGEYLKVYLSGDVLNAATSGEGPFVPMAAYLAGETVREIPPELIVWEIPERYLTLPGYPVPEPVGSSGHG